MNHSPVTLTNPGSGALAAIAVDRGCNCFSLQLPQADRLEEILWAAPGFASGAGGSALSGIPILFPFPGRLTASQFEWKGRSYVAPSADGGIPIHGLVYERPWQLIAQSESTATAEFLLSRDGAGSGCWPGDFRLTAKFALSACSLAIQITATNEGDEALPWGMGLHPYFRIPAADSSGDDCQVRIPVRESWEMAGPYATGRFDPLEDAWKFQQGTPFSQIDWDRGFTGLVFADGSTQCQIVQGANRTTIAWDTCFPHLVVYTPPHREAICLEPWTCLPDPIRLAQAGMASGLNVLAPGAAITAEVTISTG